MATVQAIVEHGTFAIDDTSFVKTIDKVKIGDHFYSDKPVIPSLFGALVYWPLHSIFALSLGYNFNIAYYLTTLFTVKLLYVVGILMLYRTTSLFNLNKVERLLITLAFTFGSLHFSWSVVFNNHSMVASLILIAFAVLFLSNDRQLTFWEAFILGLSLSMAAAADMPAMTFVVAGLVILLIKKSSKNEIIAFMIPLVIVGIIVISINIYISGSLIPFQIRSDFFAYEGSAFHDPSHLTGTTFNGIAETLRYGALLLIGPKGFALYNPWLIPALVCTVVQAIQKSKYQTLARAYIAASLPIFIYYAAFSSNYSGWSYSIRWFIPMLPLSFIFLIPTAITLYRTKRWLFITILAVSIGIAFIGAVNPWTDIGTYPWPITGNIERIQQLNFLD